MINIIRNERRLKAIQKEVFNCGGTHPLSCSCPRCILCATISNILYSEILTEEEITSIKLTGGKNEQ